MSDARGLFLLIVPSGGKWWRFRYRFQGKQSNLALGIYPYVSLEDARARRDEAWQLLAQGVNPGAVRREKKAREKADRLAAQASSTVKVSLTMDGILEIWKGRTLVRLTSEEARQVNTLMTKLCA